MPNADESSRRTFLAGIVTAGASLAIPEQLLAMPSMPGGASRDAQWLNPPHQWKQEGSSLLCTADPKTDFWRKTFYGYITDNGHLYYRRCPGGFLRKSRSAVNITTCTTRPV